MENIGIDPIYEAIPAGNDILTTQISMIHCNCHSWSFKLRCILELTQQYTDLHKEGGQLTTATAELATISDGVTVVKYATLVSV